MLFEIAVRTHNPHAARFPARMHDAGWNPGSGVRPDRGTSKPFSIQVDREGLAHC